jgi:hypothetical protein
MLGSVRRSTIPQALLPVDSELPLSLISLRLRSTLRISPDRLIRTGGRKLVRWFDYCESGGVGTKSLINIWGDDSYEESAVNEKVPQSLTLQNG